MTELTMTDVLIDLTDGVLQIRLNRPARKNALSQQMYQDMNAALQRAAEDSSIKVVLLQGADDCFSAGNDLKDFLAA
ncbi:MAG: enoyl-CoA hydratase/carnithine racemase, partial [Rheinheimera aquimaris]